MEKKLMKPLKNYTKKKKAYLNKEKGGFHK